MTNETLMFTNKTNLGLDKSLESLKKLDHELRFAVNTVIKTIIIITDFFKVGSFKMQLNKLKLIIIYRKTETEILL